MAIYDIYINDNMFTVFGTEAAYEVYSKACELGELLGAYVSLVDADTAEVLDDNAEIPEPEIWSTFIG